MILGLLTIGSLIWYLLTTNRSTDLQLIGTVDANEVIVSSKIPGRIQQLTVQEGDPVKSGQLVAVIESDDLAAAEKAAEATCRREIRSMVHYIADLIGQGLRRIQSLYPGLVHRHPPGRSRDGARVRPPAGRQVRHERLYENGVWAIFSTLDPRVLQFKPGVDDALAVGGTAGPR